MAFLQRIVTETEPKALDQVTRYLDRAGLGEGWLLVFDPRKEVSWAVPVRPSAPP